jgi:hypothetical protein
MADASHAIPEKDLGAQTTGSTNPANGLNAGHYRGYDPRNPMANIHHDDQARLPAFGGEFQPGLWRPTEHRKFANPAPLGLCAFALTTFVLSCINMNARNVTSAGIVVPLAFGYGGLVQLLAGMW